MEHVGCGSSGQAPKLPEKMGGLPREAWETGNPTLSQGEPPFLNHYSARGYFAFFAGILLGMFAQEERPRSRAVLAACGAVLALFAALLLVDPGGTGLVRYLLVLVVYPSLVLLLVQPSVSGLFKRGWVETLSRISFDVYIWHVIVILVVQMAASSFGATGALSSPAAMVAATIACFGVGAASYYLVETPIAKALGRAGVA